MPSSLIAEVFTDGSCLGNPGPGGWAALIRVKDKEWEISGGQADTTNNQMELQATIAALNALEPGHNVTVATDSKYVQQGITEWIANWKINNWRTASKKPVKNKDLWLQLDEAQAKHKVEWQWVRGHNGHKENERVDQLALEQAVQIQQAN